MTPLISIVIPSYNHAPFIGETIASVLSQSFSDIEIVITDDGSTDGTVDVIRAVQDPRINLYVFEENRGAAVALNASIQRSQGEFVCYLSSDDKFLPGKLERQLKFMRENADVAATFGMPLFIDERGLPLDENEQFNGQIFRTPLSENLSSREDWLRRFFIYGNCLCHPTAMVRRSIYDSIGLFDPRFANLPDFDMWVRLAMDYRIHVLADEMTLMRIRDDGRNMSFPRAETIIRNDFEFFEILKRYKTLNRESVGKIFYREIQQYSLDSIQDGEMVLAEIALKSPSGFHKLFGLDTMFERISQTADRNYSHLIRLTGNEDVFGHLLAVQLRNANARALQAENALDRETKDRIFAQEIVQLALTNSQSLRRSKISALLQLNEDHWQKIKQLSDVLKRSN